MSCLDEHVFLYRVFPGIFTAPVHGPGHLLDLSPCPCTCGISTSLYAIQRGNNRSACFYAEQDYQLYLDHLKEQADKYGCVVHAYVLMTNHVHLLLTPEKENSVALLMKNLGQRYVQTIHRTYRRSGTLWSLSRIPALATLEHPCSSGRVVSGLA